MSQDKVIQKVKDLLSLSKSQNVNESAVAFATAQKLLSKHRLSIADIEGTDDIVKENISDHSIYSGKRMITWKGQLANGIANVNSCKVVWRTGYSYANLVVIGTESDVEIVQFLFGSVVNQIESMCKVAIAAAKAQGKGGKTFSNNFKLGAVGAVIGRLRDAKNEVEKDYQGSKALVVIDKREQEVANWVKTNCGRITYKKAPSRRDYEAYNQGHAAGKRVDLSRGKINISKPRGFLN